MHTLLTTVFGTLPRPTGNGHWSSRRHHRNPLQSLLLREKQSPKTHPWALEHSGQRRTRDWYSTTQVHEWNECCSRNLIHGSEYSRRVRSNDDRINVAAVSHDTRTTWCPWESTRLCAYPHAAGFHRDSKSTTSTKFFFNSVYIGAVASVPGRPIPLRSSEHPLVPTVC